MKKYHFIIIKFYFILYIYINLFEILILFFYYFFFKVWNLFFILLLIWFFILFRVCFYSSSGSLYWRRYLNILFKFLSFNIEVYRLGN